MSRRVSCPTFVGRQEELGRLDAVARMARTEGQLVVVAGDAGVGKTRLIEEAAVRWRASGGAAVIGGCVDLGGLGAGYAPLREVLRRLSTDLDPSLVDRLLHEDAPDLLPLVEGTAVASGVRQDAVLAHSLAFFEAIGEHLPGLLVVFEDLHWADPSTRDLVRFLAHNVGAAKVALVLTYRIDDLHRQHPLRPLLAELSRSAAVEQLSVSGMTRSELTVLLTGVAGSVPSDVVVDDILLRSDGNPFYAEELFAADAGAVPTTLRDVVLAHVGVLSDDTQAALREASVLGTNIDGRVLALMTGRSTPAVADALRDAVARHVLVSETGGCRFRHALVREALYTDVLAGERQLLHEAAAKVIEAHPELMNTAEHERWALLAHHWGAAEHQPNAFLASVRAAKASERVGALADAVAHYQRALELWSRVPEPEAAAGSTHCDLLLCAADAMAHAGSPARAVTLVEAALELLGPESEPEIRASVLERLGNHRWVACDTPGSGAAREQAVAVLAGREPSEAKAHALAALGRHHMLVDRFVAAEETLREAIDVAAIVGSSTARASALSGLGFALAKLGRIDEGVDLARDALAIAERDGDADDIGRAYVNLTATLLAATRCDEAARVATAGIEHARRAGMLASDGVLLAYNGAEALYWLGRWDAAIALVTALPLLADRPYGTSGAVLVARIAFWRGQDAASIHHRDLALAATNAGAEPSPEALMCAGQIAARQGHFDEARRILSDALAIVETSDDLFLAAQAASLATEIEADRVESCRLKGSRAPSDVVDARAVADEVQRWMRGVVARFDRLEVSVGRDATAQLAVLEAEHARVSNELDPTRWASIADQWDALDFPHPSAVARLREAEALLRGRGSRERAAVSARAALAIAGRLEAAPLADRVRLLARRGRLDLTEPAGAPTATPDRLSQLGVSPREREVLELLAVGRTNRQIAEELYISEKTASVHVTHLLRKLGVASRVEAAAFAQGLHDEMT